MTRSNAGVTLFVTVLGAIAVGSATGVLQVPEGWRVSQPDATQSVDSQGDGQTGNGQTANGQAGSTEPVADAGQVNASDTAEQQAALATDTATPTDGQDAETPAADIDGMPTFDILRVEPNGSVLIAGNAAPGAMIEAYDGSRKLGSATAEPNGDFVIVFDEELDAGDYEIVLRADSPDGSAVTSVETAIVSVPQAGQGEVLALVEAPGEPSRLISAGEGTAEPLQQVEPAQTTAALPDGSPVPVDPAERPSASSSETASAPAEDETGAEGSTAVALAPAADSEGPGDAAAELPTARIEAVEIDGTTVFVAGSATPGARLRVYANDILLGDTIASPGGRFLVEIDRELPVGDYMIRTDIVDSVTGNVISRAAVPFERPDAERFAAVAPPPTATLPATPPVLPGAASEEPAAGTSQSAEAETVAETEPQPASETASADTGAGGATATVGATAQVGATAEVAAAETGTDEAATAAAPALTPTDGSVIIRRGDTLWQISRRVYGRGVRYTTIYTANVEQIKDPDMIWPGQIFSVPQETMENDEAAIERHRALSGG